VRLGGAAHPAFFFSRIVPARKKTMAWNDRADTGDPDLRRFWHSQAIGVFVMMKRK